MHLRSVFAFTIVGLLAASPVHAVVIDARPRSINPDPLVVCSVLSNALSNMSAVFYPGKPVPIFMNHILIQPSRRLAKLRGSDQPLGGIFLSDVVMCS